MAIKEHFIAQYLAATGARIEDTMLVEEHMGYSQAGGFTIHYWCEPLVRP
jgi:hypothetical protein